LPKLIATNIERGRSKRWKLFDTGQILPMSVDTIAPSGSAPLTLRFANPRRRANCRAGGGGGAPMRRYLTTSVTVTSLLRSAVVFSTALYLNVTLPV